MDVKQRLAEAQQEWKLLIDQRGVLDRQINALAQVIDGLTAMARDIECIGSPVVPEPTLKSVEKELGGLTNLIRGYFELAASPVFPTEIRDALQNAPIYKSGMRPLPNNLLTTVHSILSRLLENDEIQAVDREGKTAYKSVGSLLRAVRQSEKEKKDEADRRAKLRQAFGVAPTSAADTARIANFGWNQADEVPVTRSGGKPLTHPFGSVNSRTRKKN